MKLEKKNRRKTKEGFLNLNPHFDLHLKSCLAQLTSVVPLRYIEISVKFFLWILRKKVH